MKLHTAAFAALTGLGLCVAPAAFAQSSATDKSAVETKVKAMEDKWEAAEMEKDHGASTVGEMLASDYNGFSITDKSAFHPETALWEAS